MARGQVQLAVVPTRALRLTLEPKLCRRIAVEAGNQLTFRRQVGDPSGTDGDEPEIASVVERSALQKLTLRLIVYVGEQRNRSDAGWRRR